MPDLRDVDAFGPTPLPDLRDVDAFGPSTHGPPPLLECRQLRKAYEGRVVVDGISFEVGQGEIVGLLGPNGAGKTTLMRAILDLVPADAGEVLLEGLPLRGLAKERLGYLPEERGLPGQARIGEILSYLLRLRGLSHGDAEQAARAGLDRVGLTDYADKEVSALSKGMLGRLTFVAATAHRPQLLVLDEPFSGLDPVGVAWMTEAIERCCAEGSSILLSAHQMHLVERLCHRIVMVARGRRVLYGSVAEIRRDYPADRIRVKLEDPTVRLEAFLPYPVRQGDDGQAEILVGHEGAASILASLCAQGLAIRSFEPVHRSLEEVFFEVLAQTTHPDPVGPGFVEETARAEEA